MKSTDIATPSPAHICRVGDLAEIIAGPIAGLVGTVAEIVIDDGPFVGIELQDGRMAWAEADDVRPLETMIRGDAMTKHEDPIEGGNNPCGCCPPIPTQAPMNKIVAVGFGAAQVYRNDEFVADGETGILIRNGVTERFEPWTLTFGDVEEMALLDSEDSDWRIVLHGAMHGETYQRQGPEQWVCIERNQGFA